MPNSVEKVVDEWPGDDELCCGDEGGSQVEPLDLLQQSGVVLTGGNRQKGIPVHDAGLGQAGHPEKPLRQLTNLHEYEHQAFLYRTVKEHFRIFTELDY